MERDIELNHNNSEMDLDVQVSGGDLKLGAMLSNRIIISLFTWGPAAPGDEIPDGVKQGGWWGDDVASSESETPSAFGSRIWEICGKITDETISLVESYARESLEWLGNEESVDGYNIVASRSGLNGIDLIVTLEMSNGEIQRLIYADVLNWGK